MHNIYYLGLSGEHRCPLGYLLWFSLAIYLIVALPCSTFHCDSHMHSFLFLYSRTVLLFVILPCSLFDCNTGIPFNFELFRSPLECNTLWQ